MIDESTAVLGDARSQAGAAGPRREAAALLAQLLTDTRRWHPLTGAEMARLRGLPRLQALVESSRSLMLTDPESMLVLAKLARWAAESLRMREYGGRRVADLRALAWAELANAYRVCDDLSRASGAMHRAIHWCLRGSGSELLLARLAAFLSTLLAYQRKFEPSRELLALVEHCHSGAGRWRAAGRTLIQQGYLADLEGDPARALVLHRRGFDLLDPVLDRRLVHLALVNMLHCLEELGRYRSARRLLWRTRHLYVDCIEENRLRWLEAKIFAGLGEADRAEAAFQQAREGFNAVGQIYPAARAGLDLAILWARQGQVEKVYSMCEECVATFRALRISREAIATLLVLRRANLVGGQLIDGIEMAMGFLRRLGDRPRAHQGAPGSR